MQTETERWNAKAADTMARIADHNAGQRCYKCMWDSLFPCAECRHKEISRRGEENLRREIEDDEKLVERIRQAEGDDKLQNKTGG